MKRNILKINKFMTSIVFLSIVLIGVLINISKDNLNEAVTASTLSEMSKVGTQLELRLEETLKTSREELSFLAQYIVKYNVQEDEVIDFLIKQSITEEFTTLYYIDKNGNGISLDNEKRDFSDNQSYLNALNNDFYVANPYVFPETNEMHFDTCVPVIADGEIVAALFSEATINDFMDTMQKNTAGTGDMFLVDQELNLIFSTSEIHADTSTIPDGDVSEMGMDNVLQARLDISENQNGGFYYDYYGIPKVMVYYPIDNTKWALAMNVEVDSINATLISAVKSFETVGSIIYWTVTILVIYISLVQSQSNKKLTKTAYYDSLTELPNSVKLKEDMTSALSKNKNSLYSLIVFDIENFKAINEMFGRDMGDRVLKSVKQFSEGFSQPDLITARIADDKFAMFAGREFLEDISHLESHVDEHTAKIIPEMMGYGAVFKIGRYRIQPGETDFDDIMTKTNLAHRRAKSTKGMLYCDYDDAFRKQLLTEANITNKMRAALENEEFKVFLQPKFNTHDNKLIGAEALVRWIEADGTMIFPNDFIPLFERNGFIVELDRYILENVCKILKRWLNDGLGQLTVSVNCSRLNLENPFFVDGVVAITDKYSLPHGCIEIELTESTTIANESIIEQLFADLHKNGFKISIDDFGSGYSSLGMLKNLKVDTLKMDRSFFIAGKNARRDDLLIDSIVKMSHNLGMYVVAEGIETKEQVEMLKNANCDAIQGYVHAKPMPISEFEEKYTQAMIDNISNPNDSLLVIHSINDINYASSFVPSGIVITEIDEHFTMLEANDYYFDLIGYTREEVRDVFKNRGLNNMNKEGREEFLAYFYDKIQTEPNANIEFTNRFTLKDGKEHIFQLIGKVAVDEHGKKRLYMSVTDITEYSKLVEKMAMD